MGIKNDFLKVLRHLGEHDPTAPLVLQTAYSACNRIGKLFASVTTLDAVAQHADRLLKDYPSDNDDYAADPAFIMALASILANALVAWIRSKD